MLTCSGDAGRHPSEAGTPERATMDDDGIRILAATTLVALAGGFVAFFALTKNGRRALRQVGPALDNICDTLDEVRAIVQSLDRVVQEASATVADIRDAMPPTLKDDSPATSRTAINRTFDNV